jgi:enamine deaminase RidA (YjgF/YER057c/UK114 family)
MSDRFTIVNPPELDAPRGFAHGLIATAPGRMLFVAGQIGIDDGTVRLKADATYSPSDGNDFIAQFERALERVLIVVTAAGGRAEHIARMTVYVTSMERYRDARGALRGVWRRHMGSHYPAMALVAVTALVDPNARVEIEATAVLP